jgi:hypothetical protein
MDATIIAAIIGGVASIIGLVILVRNKSGNKDHDVIVQTPQIRSHTKNFFTAGCGVGNRIALLPFPPNADATGMNLLIDALIAIGVHDSFIEPIIEVRDTLLSLPSKSLTNEIVREKIMKYFEIVSAIPETIQIRSSPEVYNWFKFGHLLFELGTLNAINLSAEEEDTKIATAIALESLIEGLHFPSSLRNELTNVITLIKEQRNSNNIPQYVNRIANATLLLF